MAEAQTTETFNCTPEQFYNILKDYENYPKFLSEVKQVKVIKTEGEKKLVEFNVSVIKTFTYRIWITEKPNKHISWTFDSGDVFKVSNGSWDLAEAPGGKTKAHYAVEAKFNIFVPGPIAKALVSVNLPNMINSYHKRVKELYG